MSYVYEQSEPGLWTVGHYDPQGKWHGDSDHSDREEAAQRVHWLNGGEHTVRIDGEVRFDRIIPEIKTR